MAANAVQVGKSYFADFVYGPVVDGVFTTDLPGKALLTGAYVKDVDVLVGHNSNEGISFADPFLTTDDQLSEFIRVAFPQATPQVVDYIFGVLYPPPPQNNGTLVYTTNTDRLALAIGEGVL